MIVDCGIAPTIVWAMRLSEGTDPYVSWQALHDERHRQEVMRDKLIIDKQAEVAAALSLCEELAKKVQRSVCMSSGQDLGLG